MKKVHFFVEDNTHKFFLKQFVETIFKYTLNENTDFTITKSWGGIKYERNKILELQKDEIPIVIFIDSDIDFYTRKTQVESILEKMRNEMDVSFPYRLFIFPDNKSTGNIESLLSVIAKEISILRCFEQYEKCTEKFNSPNAKAKIYAYLWAVDSSKVEDKKRDYTNANYWNLNHAALEPLKNFLSSVLIGY